MKQIKLYLIYRETKSYTWYIGSNRLIKNYHMWSHGSLVECALKYGLDTVKLNSSLAKLEAEKADWISYASK